MRSIAPRVLRSLASEDRRGAAGNDGAYDLRSLQVCGCDRCDRTMQTRSKPSRRELGSCNVGCAQQRLTVCSSYRCSSELQAYGILNRYGITPGKSNQSGWVVCTLVPADGR